MICSLVEVHFVLIGKAPLYHWLHQIRLESSRFKLLVKLQCMNLVALNNLVERVAVRNFQSYFIHIKQLIHLFSYGFSLLHHILTVLNDFGFLRDGYASKL